MTSLFQPSPNAEPAAPWLTAFLVCTTHSCQSLHGAKADWLSKSQRDLSLRIPLNYVTYPGIDLTSACFGRNVFAGDAAALCFSNLLATGFRRFVVDLYWDDGRRVWSFCPFQLPVSVFSPETPASSTEAFTSSTVTVSSVDITPRSNSPDSARFNTATTATSHQNKVVDQQTSPAVAPQSTLSTTTTSSGPQATSSIEPTNATTLVTAGPYACTPSIDLPVLTAVLAEYMRNSSDTLHAWVTYMTLNLHVARPPSAPLSSGTSLNSSLFPTNQLISTLLSVNLSSYLYTPTLLREDRANLNATWYADGESLDGAYLNTTRDDKGQLSTKNGWPSESFLEFTNRAYRLLAEFGQVDPQLGFYNLTGDETMVFPQNTLENSQSAQLGVSGDLDCFFNSNESSISRENNSWAVSTQLQSTRGVGLSATNLISCGISPILNETLLNATADSDITAYQAVAYSSIWSWLPGEPRVIPSSAENSAHLRCSAFNGSADGRWRVSDCTERHFAACRVADEPYVWRISSSKATYSSSNMICPAGSSFAVPRTALENRHLLTAVSQRTGEDAKDMIVWLNFNSLDVERCWVFGVNSLCPYRSAAGDITRRAVIVPTVAAVIVFLIAALTVFIKCAANRQKSRRGRRRRRADDGWDYEGVPS
jgi:hypothetical protein